MWVVRLFRHVVHKEDVCSLHLDYQLRPSDLVLLHFHSSHAGLVVVNLPQLLLRLVNAVFILLQGLIGFSFSVIQDSRPSTTLLRTRKVVVVILFTVFRVLGFPLPSIRPTHILFIRVVLIAVFTLLASLLGIGFIGILL